MAFVAGKLELPDCHARPIWSEPLVAVLPEQHRLAGQSAITWTDLVGETFLVRSGGTGPQVHDHIVLRLTGLWLAPSIQCFDVERSTLLSMVGQGFGITITASIKLLVVVIIDAPAFLNSGKIFPYPRVNAFKHLQQL